MTKPKAKSKKRNPNDATLRNVRALKKRVDLLERHSSEDGSNWVALAFLLSELNESIRKYLNCEQHYRPKRKGKR